VECWSATTIDDDRLGANGRLHRRHQHEGSLPGWGADRHQLGALTFGLMEGDVNYTAVIMAGERRLSDEQRLVWDPIAASLGLSPYTCKALYVCGLLRQRLEAAGLSLRNGFLLDAQSSALGATEMLGQCVGGIEQINRVTRRRFDAALPYLISLDPSASPPEIVDLSSEGAYRLRCFIDHGAAAIDEDTRFTLPSIIWLLRRLAQALDQFWEADNDPDGRLDRFARAAIRPLFAKSTNPPESFIPFIEDTHIFFAQGGRPGAPIRFDDHWRTDDATHV
jgi:hypothetical protein